MRNDPGILGGRSGREVIDPNREIRTLRVHGRSDCPFYDAIQGEVCVLNHRVCHTDERPRPTWCPIAGSVVVIEGPSR